MIGQSKTMIQDYLAPSRAAGKKQCATFGAEFRSSGGATHFDTAEDAARRLEIEHALRTRHFELRSWPYIGAASTNVRRGNNERLRLIRRAKGRSLRDDCRHHHRRTRLSAEGCAVARSHARHNAGRDDERQCIASFVARRNGRRRQWLYLQQQRSSSDGRELGS